MPIIFDLDDIHPEHNFFTQNSIEEKILDKLVQLVPRLKINLFVTPNWTFRSQLPIHKLSLELPVSLVRKWPINTFRLDKFPKWCSWLKHKTMSGRFFLGVHGLYHFQNQWPYAAEFESLSESEVKHRLKTAEEIFGAARLDFQKVFRPPGWGVNAELLEVLKNENYCLAGKELINADIAQSKVNDLRRLIGEGKLVVMHGHISSRCGLARNANGLKNNYSNLKKMLFALRAEEFLTYEDIK